MFEAKEVDARPRAGWMPQVLIDAAPLGPTTRWPPAFDLGTAWRVVLPLPRAENERPDAQALLAWTQQPDAVARLEALPPRRRRTCGCRMQPARSVD